MFSSRDVKLLLYFWMGVGLLLLLALAWWGAASQFNQLVAAGAAKMVPQSVRVESVSQEVRLVGDESPGKGSLTVGLRGTPLQAGLLVMLALVLATPGMPFWTRVGWATGVTVFFLLLNMGTVALSAWALLWTVHGGVVTVDRVEQLVAGVYLAVPFALAAVWCWRLWLPGLARGREQTAAR
ncbi:MAG: hypothetical protein Q8O40_17785 [Chloroflexota bacterium]|nr:hypothetical protein [Chloroflexota bacterium]